MSTCCPHDPTEHQLLSTCQQVIHYPSEDYPCLCTGFAGDADVCLECDHLKRQHRATRVCKPASGEYCGCGGEATAG